MATQVELLTGLVNVTIPEVYQKGMSYYEVLTAVVNKVNELIKQSNEYFSEDVQTVMTKILNGWKNDGTLSALISDAVLDIGDRQYTEQNYVTNGETVTASIDAIDTTVASHLADIVNVTNTVASHLADNVYVTTFGAHSILNPGYETFDSTNAIKNAISSSNGVVNFPEGDFLISGSGAEILSITKAIILRGSGSNTRLIVKADTPLTTDIIKISPPDTDGDNNQKLLYAIENMQIIPQGQYPGDYTVGRNAINIDITNAGQYLAKLSLEKLVVGRFGGKAINLINPTNIDGFFSSNILDCLFYGGGTNFERMGDSVNLIRNTFTGRGIGIDMSSVSSAAMVIIENNNFTSDGAIRIRSGDQIKIIHNQIEQTMLYTGTDDAMIVVGVDGYVKNCEIIGNNLNTHATQIKHAIKVNKATNCKIDDNYMYKGLDNIINVTENAQKTVIGDNNQLENETNTGTLRVIDYVTDNGVGTKGVEKELVLLNSWGNFDAVYLANPYLLMDSSGIVHLHGTISGGTASHGTTITVLPLRFRPKKDIYFPIICSDQGTLIMGRVLITSGGSIQLIGTNLGNTFIELSGISFKAN